METNDAIFFYGTGCKYGFMSNFYQCKFVHDNQTFNCSEQYFMYKKALTFDPNNEILLTSILNSSDPKEIKSFGRQVKNFDEKTWDQVKFKIMTEGILLKFTQNEDIRQELIKTEDKKLYEASKYDKIWGIGYNPQQAARIDPSKFGKNLLGESLMLVRTFII